MVLTVRGVRAWAVVAMVALPVAGCGGAPKQRHNIAGTAFGWTESGHKVIRDVRIGALQVRHVRGPSKTCLDGYYDHLELNGPIDIDSAAAVERLLENVAKCKTAEGRTMVPTIYLNSNGGITHYGIQMGEVFRRHGVQTYVTGGQFCASSCAIAFLGGRFRTVAHDGKLLFHATYIKDGETIRCFNRQQSGEILAYYKKMIGEKDGEFLFDREIAHCSETSGWTLNAGAALTFNVANTEAK